MILPKMDYGSVLYFGAKEDVLKPLSVKQNECLRIATGALFGTKIEVLEVEANQPPLYIPTYNILYIYI